MLYVPRILAGILLMLFCVQTPHIFAQNIVIVFYSEQGHTKAMAESVAKGARASHGSEVRLLSVDKASAKDLLWAEAIIVGSPVHAANVAAPIQKFLSGMPWDQKLKDKIGAAFVTGGGISLGEELTQLNILHSMLVYNMIVVGGPTDIQAFGASAITDEDPFVDKGDQPWVDPRFLAKGEALGKRVAEVARKLHSPK